MFMVETEDNQICTYTTSWQELADGNLSRKNRSELTLIKGKNIGRANETTPYSQAELELASDTKKKIDAGYHLSGVESEVLPLPMLAHKFTERSKYIEWPCFLQPKLDGFRAIYDGNKFWSRKGKLYIPKVVEHLMFNTGEMLLDGEIMLPPGYTFEQTCSAIKKFDPELSPKLQYYVFDVVDGNNNWFSDRLDALDAFFRDFETPEGVHMVKTMLCESPQDVEKFLEKALRQGYEGVMLRNQKGIYRINQRSNDLLKYKLFEDAEFKVVDCKEGTGREAEALMYRCETPGGLEFDVRPKGTIIDRKQLWKRWSVGTYDPRGKMLTVRYQALNSSGVPRFPVGIAVRED
jgi:DNA ligase-1